MAEATDPVPTSLWSDLQQKAAALGVLLTAAQIQALARYLEMLREWNTRFNLTAIEDPAEMLTKHFLDSLTCARVVDFARVRTLIDVGTGAGFPGLVLKIAYPHLEVTLLDSLEKRLRFLDRVSEELDLEGVRTVHARAEDAAAPGASLREHFDLVTARAVAQLRVLAEWTLPFAALDGALLAMKGPHIQPEIDEAGPALRKLGGIVERVEEFELPASDVGRSLVLIRKKSRTPREFPRRPGAARKAPL